MRKILIMRDEIISYNITDVFMYMQSSIKYSRV